MATKKLAGFHWSFYLAVPLAIAYFCYPFYILKAAPVWACAVAAFVQGHRYGRMVSLGLVLGSAGDILLEMDSEYGVDLFLPGLVAFLLGHLCYCRAFFRAFERHTKLVVFPALFLYYALLMGLLLPKVEDALIAPVMVYALVICSMVLLGVNRFLASASIPIETRRTCFVGCLFFLASDTLLSFRLFYGNFPGGGYLVMITYYIGQFLICASAQRPLDLDSPDALEIDTLDSIENALQINSGHKKDSLKASLIDE